jgi:hypothetical protein
MVKVEGSRNHAGPCSSPTRSIHTTFTHRFSLQQNPRLIRI